MRTQAKQPAALFGPIIGATAVLMIDRRSMIVRARIDTGLLVDVRSDDRIGEAMGGASAIPKRESRARSQHANEEEQGKNPRRQNPH
jgi:hypothetical protein